MGDLFLFNDAVLAMGPRATNRPCHHVDRDRDLAVENMVVVELVEILLRHFGEEVSDTMKDDVCVLRSFR